MVCDPNEHNFVKQTSYSIELETDSAVVKEGTEEKRCTECGKTPDELGDFVSSETKQETTETTTDSTETDTQNIETNDDAVIMGSDNSESQAAQQQAASVTHGNEVDTEEEVYAGDQTDDAYIIESDGAEVTTADETDTETEETLVPAGPTLHCPNCGFQCPDGETPHYPGDSCPECKREYLQKE